MYTTHQIQTISLTLSITIHVGNTFYTNINVHIGTVATEIVNSNYIYSYFTKPTKNIVPTIRLISCRVEYFYNLKTVQYYNIDKPYSKRH